MNYIIRLIATVFVLVYFATVLITHYLKQSDERFFDLFFILTSPWSSIIAIFSNLLIHVADDGIKLMDNAKILGSIINSIIVLTIIWKFKKKVCEN